MVTFLYKSTVNLILQLISHEMKSRVSSKIKKAGIFTVQVDSTLDASAKNQISIIHRYVASDNLVKKRLFTLLDADKSTEEYYLQLLKDVLQSEKIDISYCNCIGDTSEGVSNIQRIYRSSPPEVFLEKGVLKICNKCTGEHL